MKHLLTVAFVFSFMTVAHAQYPTDNDLPKNDRVKKIKLTSQAASDLLPVAIPVSGIQVVPVCGDTARLGFVQVGMMNKKISAAPDKPWNIYLQDFANTRYKPAFTENGAQLLWVIKDLRINERTFAMSEKAYVRLKADAYISKDKVHYQLLTSLDTVLTHGGMDVTHTHDQNIADAFHLLWLGSMTTATAGSAQLLTEDILSKEQSRFAVPILQTSAYTSGVYKTYQEFLNNQPSVSDFTVEVKKRKVVVNAKNADSSTTVIENPWGVCKDGELYRYYAYTLVPIERSGNAFVVSNYLDAINRKNQSIFWGAMTGGIAGGLIGSTADKTYTVTTIPYITKQQPDATTVDVDNGDLMF